MRLKRPTPLAVFAFLLICAAAARAQSPAPEIEFTVAWPRPHTRLLEVEMRLRYAATPPAAVELSLPVWTPGSYLVREFERHVQDFAPEGGDARALAWAKADKNTWRVETGGARELRVRYSVYANELSVRTNELNDRRAVWNNAALLMYPEGHLRAPSTVRVVAPGGWNVATGLPAVAGQGHLFRADNFDQLYDSPFLASEFQQVSFEIRGVPHRVVFDGPGNFDLNRTRTDVQRIFEAAVALMGDIPYKDYTVIVLQGPARGGGLEHRNSTLLLWPRFRFSDNSDWLEFLALVSHEIFHAWNVKLIRPEPLGPFDYSRENYTRLLWVAEGVTAYYEPLLLRRAGLISDRQFLEQHARLFQQLQETPGRFEQSIEEASFDAWIEYYRQDENTVNTNVSYYDKGQVVAFLLDLEIRRRSDGRRSLDDVMRRLYAEFGKRDRNYTPADFQRAAEQEAGGSLAEFFDAYVRGRRELDYNAALEAVGLRLDMTGEGLPGAGRERAWLGANLTEEGGRLTVRNVPAGSPAYEQGLAAFDQIVAVEGYRATREFLDARLREKRPGDALALTVFRADELRTLNVKLGGRVEAPYRILPVRNPTDRQSRLYQSWLNATLPRP